VQAQSLRYLPVFFYASIFWMALGALHLTAITLEDVQAGNHYDLSPQRWVHFLLSYFCWAFLSTVVYALIERHPPSRSNWRWLLGFVLTLIVWLPLISLIVQSLNGVIWGRGPSSLADMLAKVSPFLYLFNALKIAMIYGACAGIVYYRRLQDAQLELLTLERLTAEVMEKKSRYELQALQAQLSPHFLFNALNSVSAMARNEDNQGVVKTIAHLAGLLRYAVEAANQPEVILDEELTFTANYIALQKIRFGDGFAYDIALQLDDGFASCPPFCIQTLVENVFSHNELSSRQPVKISVKVSQDEQVLSVRVDNSEAAPLDNPGSGVGLRNLSERMQLLYGAQAQLSTWRHDNGFSARITLPTRAIHD
jgi:hypothetical protein